jgi:hypothetical protein
MSLRQIARKVLAVAALAALLIAGTPALAESLSTSNLPACCNNIYCPMRRGPARGHRTICGAQGNFAGSSCICTCDATPPPVVGTAPYVLIAPIGIRYQATAEPAQISGPKFFSSVVSIPLTPPPRTLPS